MATSFKDKIEELKKRHVICSDDEAREAIEFVSSLMDLHIKQTQKDEPYAQNWIRDADDARRKIDGLTEFYDEQIAL